MASSTATTSHPDAQKLIASLTQNLEALRVNTAKSPEADNIIDTVEAMSDFLDALGGLPTVPPPLYVDLEGENLSRQGTLSILQVHVRPTKRTYLIDILTLHDDAFTTRSAQSGDTFKEILENANIPKVFFDVRNDSDALHAHYGIQLQGVQDLQLMELATRTFGRRYVTGLAKCIEKDAQLPPGQSRSWKENKERGLRLFDPVRGGSYAVFNQRPLAAAILRYCIDDVHHLSRLWDIYNMKMTQTWRDRVLVATRDRVKESQSVNYRPNGSHKALAPQAWARY